MAEVYLKQLRTIVERFAVRHNEAVELEYRHFFSGAAAYVNGRIFMSLSPAGLALKLPEADRKPLMDEGAKPLKCFPKAPVKKEYVVLPDRIVEDKSELAAWMARSIEFAGK